MNAMTELGLVTLKNCEEIDMSEIRIAYVDCIRTIRAYHAALKGMWHDEGCEIGFLPPDYVIEGKPSIRACFCNLRFIISQEKP